TPPEPENPGDPGAVGKDHGRAAVNTPTPASCNAHAGSPTGMSARDPAPRDTPAQALLKPMDINRLAPAPHVTVIGRLAVGHPRAGVLPRIDLAETGKRHSYRIRRADWEAFLARLQTVPRERERARPQPRPSTAQGKEKGMFRY